MYFEEKYQWLKYTKRHAEVWGSNPRKPRKIFQTQKLWNYWG